MGRGNNSVSGTKGELKQKKPHLRGKGECRPVIVFGLSTEVKKVSSRRSSSRGGTIKMLRVDSRRKGAQERLSRGFWQERLRR